MRIVPAALSRLASRFLPQDCLVCGAQSGTALLCEPCTASLPRLTQERCPVCALPTPLANVCGACLKTPPHFDATLALFTYAFPVDRLIQALKYQAKLALANYFGEALAREALPTADLLIPLPLHPLRLRERGFNQAVEIARPLALPGRLQLALDASERHLDTAPQASLAWNKRQRNVRGAFLCRVDLSRKHVIVIDDVMTSGATLDEFARSLKSRGALRVTNLVVARTLPH